MIAHLTGKLLFKQATSVVVDVNGVGYEVTIPLSTFYELGEINSDISLRIYTQVREDILQLFGFRTAREREVFLKLLSVQGVGPKLAVTMLSSLSADEIIGAIRSNNLARLVSIPGVGKKTAERMVLDLRDKIAELSSPDLEEKYGTGEQAAAEIAGNAVYDDALSALVNLGYPKPTAEKALKQAMQEGTEHSVQKLLRRSLQFLAKG
jgi:Holliday junction DNA helicase RuvA